MTNDIGSKASIPNPALEPFARLVGEWRTSGTHPFFGDLVLHGRARFAWQDGGAFLVWRSEVDHPKVPEGIAIFGSDDAAGTFFLTYFDERKVSRRYEVTVQADGFTMERQDPKLTQRMTFSFSGNDRIVSKGEMSREGGPWEGDLSLTYERVSGNS